ncbi:hypothetical protein VNO78_16115 [Psophocarpus tetragonolobus]|uniref:Uncharacterized protein n=1 Tax=Psophocarpus tetragonolobus TaxID=3891 RepID=A0AAN9SF79_PSOTE
MPTHANSLGPLVELVEEEHDPLGQSVEEERNSLGFRKLTCEAQSMREVEECVANTFSKGCVSKDDDERMQDKSSCEVGSLHLSEPEMGQALKN